MHEIASPKSHKYHARVGSNWKNIVIWIIICVYKTCIYIYSIHVYTNTTIFSGTVTHTSFFLQRGKDSTPGSEDITPWGKLRDPHWKNWGFHELHDVMMSGLNFIGLKKRTPKKTPKTPLLKTSWDQLTIYRPTQVWQNWMESWCIKEEVWVLCFNVGIPGFRYEKIPIFLDILMEFQTQWHQIIGKSFVASCRSILINDQ